MKEGLTELVFILDRSGSMTGLESDTIGGFNSLLHKQRQEQGEALVSTVLFDHLCEVVHDRDPIDRVADLTEKEYYTRGNTALNDAVGSAIHHIGTIHKYAREEDRPEHTLFVITTDGYENSSCRYSLKKVKEMIKRQEERFGWKFLFLGANIDAQEVACEMGIDIGCAVEYMADEEGTRLNYDVLNTAISQVRDFGAPAPGWCDAIRADVERRRK